MWLTIVEGINSKGEVEYATMARITMTEKLLEEIKKAKKIPGVVRCRLDIAFCREEGPCISITS